MSQPNAQPPPPSWRASVRLWSVKTPGYSAGTSSPLPLFKPIHRVEMIETTNNSASAPVRHQLTKRVLFNGERPVIQAQLPELAMSYTPGDSVTLHVSNTRHTAQHLLAILEIPEDAPLAFQRIHLRTNKTVFSYSGTVLEYFQHYLDITSLPSKLFLYRMSEWAAEPHSSRLGYLATKEGGADYFGLSKNWNTLIDLLEAFSVRPPLAVLLEVSTEIKPRAFSLTNRQEEPVEFLCGAVFKQHPETPSRRYGHVSSYLLEEDPSTTSSLVYHVGHKPNRLLQMSSQSGVLIGVGTGIAPFISFLRHQTGQQFILFYGCRRQSESILHAMNLIAGAGEACEYQGARKFYYQATPVYLVYSREDCSIHLDTFFQTNPLTTTIIHKLPNVYVCGNRDVQRALSRHFASVAPRATLFIDDWA